jgi:8-oxo-dGTP diphosphatase
MITQRRKTAVLPLMWEFPGGRVEGSESDVEALQREVMHRLGARIQCGALISFVNHPYEHYSVDLYLYGCELLPQETLDARAVNDFKWVASSEFDRYSFTPADEASMTKLLGLN